ncbi:hypothetical protein HMPREF0262_00675 [Clostridium sp. ATCC 29733]|nr:hypothetical protein HMPREF0262_00675 [Clostridium sp. ATCC 29733]
MNRPLGKPLHRFPSNANANIKNSICISHHLFLRFPLRQHRMWTAVTSPPVTVTAFFSRLSGAPLIKKAGPSHDGPAFSIYSPAAFTP